jgi:alpha-tubulin suppressor-like RCC1 family protein
MGNNVVRKILTGNSTMTVPAGVKRIDVFSIRKNNSFMYSGDTQNTILSRKTTGEVWGWGVGNLGQLGNNATLTTSSPVQVAGGHLFAEVVSETTCSTGRRYDGVIMSWGSGPNGVLGNNTTTGVSSPVIVAGSNTYRALVGYGQTRLALANNGAAYGWGLNTSGQLGINSLTSVSSPTIVAGGHLFNKIYTRINTSAGIKADGSAYTWGTGASGELGNNTQTSTSSPVLVAGAKQFVKLENILGTMGGLTKSGDIYTWGAGNVGQLGNNTLTGVSSPVLVAGGHKFTDFVAHKSAISFYAKRTDGVWMSWGQGTGGVLGNNSTSNFSSPVVVVGSHLFVKLTSDETEQSVYALKNDGTIWSWGNNGNGNLGNNSLTNTSSPVQAAGPQSFIDVYGGSSKFFARTAGGVIFSAGSGSNGALGNNSTTTASSPVQVAGQTFADNALQNDISFLPRTQVIVTPGNTVSYTTGLIGSFAGQILSSELEAILIEYES